MHQSLDVRSAAGDMILRRHKGLCDDALVCLSLSYMLVQALYFVPARMLLPVDSANVAGNSASKTDVVYLVDISAVCLACLMLLFVISLLLKKRNAAASNGLSGEPKPIAVDPLRGNPGVAWQSLGYRWTPTNREPLAVNGERHGTNGTLQGIYRGLHGDRDFSAANGIVHRGSPRGNDLFAVDRMHGTSAATLQATLRETSYRRISSNSFRLWSSCILQCSIAWCWLFFVTWFA